MTDNTQPEALRALAEAAAWTGTWYDAGCNTVHCTYDKADSIEHDEIAHPVPLGVSAYIAAAHPQAVIALLDRIAELEAQLEAAGFTAADMATAEARGFRDGAASVAASAPAPSAHIKEPYTLAEIKAKIASDDYSAELLLQHAMLLLDSASLAASAGEPRDLNPRHIRKFLQALQAGEMSVGRAVEILDAWVGGYYSDEMVPPPPADSCLIADDDFPMEIVRKLRSELAAAGDVSKEGA